MWKHYRKTFFPVQIVIFTLLTVLYFTHVDPRNLLMVFMVMQLSSIFGARMVGA